MFTRIFMLFVITVSIVASANSQTAQWHYSEVPASQIQPKGWLLNQLQIMRKGTTGHLDEVYAKLQNDNGWLGGKGDGWEETPYWLDGAVPLAWLLNDKELQDKVKRYINWTIANQRPSGYFGPVTKWERETNNKITANNCDKGEDWWPKMVMLKVIQQYYLATKDPRVIPFMTNYFHYQLQALQTCAIGKWTEWAQSRGTDNALMAQWLYHITKDDKLLQLAELIHRQSFQWSDWLGNRDWVINAAAYQNDKAWMTRHGVNVAMAIKDPAVKYQRTKDEKQLHNLKTGFNDLMTLHGLPMGIFSADEDIHGNDPSQGTELCAIVEAQYSLEQIIAITGDLSFADALERMTFNALPSQTTDDYNAKQYFQIANQVQVSRGVFNFSLPFDRSMNNVFGMRSGYTCCLANMHQGWTKFASHLWFGTPGNGIAALTYSPNQLTARLGTDSIPVTINEVTNYPFEDMIRFEITAPAKKQVTFPLHLRIPAWCKKPVITFNGQTLPFEQRGQLVVIDRVWKNGDKIGLQLNMELTTSNWGKNSRTIERGPLVYALKLEEDWQMGQEPAEGLYYSVFPKGNWNYGLLESVVKDPSKQLEVKTVKSVTGNFIWNLSHAPIEIIAPAKKLPAWRMFNETAPQPVTDRNGIYKGPVDDKEEKITLVPFGCTKVRIVAFPVVK